MAGFRATPRGAGDRVARSSSVDDDLRDLQISGYRIRSSTRVALLPVDLAEAELPAAAPGGGER